MRVVLITGGTGALGRYLVGSFTAAEPCEIVVLTRDPRSACRPDPERSAREGSADIVPVRQVRGDVTGGASLGIDTAELGVLHASVTDIVHCAANTSFTSSLDRKSTRLNSS